MYKTINGWTKESMKAHITQNFKGKSIKRYGDDELDVVCAYRGYAGRKCAVGLFIPNERYEPFFEGRAASTLIKMAPDLAQVLPLDGVGLDELQNQHDYGTEEGTLNRILTWIDREVEG